MKKSYVLFASISCMILMLSGCMVVSTGPTEVGVRTKKIGPNKGIEQTIYSPGATYFFLPFINDWHTFDTKLVNVEMTFNTNQGDRKRRDDLLFKTIDGNDISLDVIISYRLDPMKAPYILEYVARDNDQLKDSVIRTIARSRPRDIFGELMTEEFYVSSKRDEKAQQALDELNRMVQSYGIIVEKVLTRDYRFNPAYQQAIEDKKVADQMAEKNRSSAKAATEEYLKKLEEAKGEVAKMKAKVDGEYTQATIAADAYYEQQSKIAEAIEAEGLADARGIEEMNKALAGSGGEVMVKLKIAEALIGKKILLLPVSSGGIDFRTLDLNKLIQSSSQTTQQ
ncbi:prohibitin family protein [bacterium]|nr:prohibitin family protein [candidate division CSSED10-310 bacterium]